MGFSLFGHAVHLHGAALFNFAVTISMLLVAFTSPLLGAWADSRASKKKFLAVYVAVGVVSTAMLATVGQGDWLSGAFWFILANFGFAGGNVFYNAFLPELAGPSEMGRVSGFGWGIGYLGGGLLLALNLIMLEAPGLLGLPPDSLTVHHTFLTVAVWWLLFSLPLFALLRERAISTSPSFFQGARDSWARLRSTMRHMKRYRHLWNFLLAYLFFNDGIETVILMAAIFGDQELRMNQSLLIVFFLVVQFTAFLGSWVFGRLTLRFGIKRTLISTLVVWCGIVIDAFFIGWSGFPIQEYFVLGVVAGIVMGASQSLARALQGVFTPEGKQAEFFGFFAVSGRFASVLGPLTYGIIIALTGSLRIGIISLIVFFLLGILLLTRVNEREGRLAAGLGDDARLRPAACDSLLDGDWPLLATVPGCYILYRAKTTHAGSEEQVNDLDQETKTSRGRILIVDDEVDITDFLSTYFRMKGYETAVANSGLEAVNQLQWFNPHVILLDVRMPGMDGIDTLKRIRDVNTRVGVIMVTAVHEMNIGREALALGAADFVTKPIDLEYLETTVMVKLVSLLSD